MKRLTDFLIPLALCGVLALNFPLLSLFDRAVLWLGIPALYLYLFLAWAVFIGCMIAVMEKKEPPSPLQKERGEARPE